MKNSGILVGGAVSALASVGLIKETITAVMTGRHWIVIVVLATAAVIFGLAAEEFFRESYGRHKEKGGKDEKE